MQEHAVADAGQPSLTCPGDPTIKGSKYGHKIRGTNKGEKKRAQIRGPNKGTNNYKIKGIPLIINWKFKGNR